MSSCDGEEDHLPAETLYAVLVGLTSTLQLPNVLIQHKDTSDDNQTNNDSSSNSNSSVVDSNVKRNSEKIPTATIAQLSSVMIQVVEHLIQFHITPFLQKIATPSTMFEKSPAARIVHASFGLLHELPNAWYLQIDARSAIVEPLVRRRTEDTMALLKYGLIF